jgi:hypothetical protein
MTIPDAYTSIEFSMFVKPVESGGPRIVAEIKL